MLDDTIERRLRQIYHLGEQEVAVGSG